MEKALAGAAGDESLAEGGGISLLKIVQGAVQWLCGAAGLAGVRVGVPGLEEAADFGRDKAERADQAGEAESDVQDGDPWHSFLYPIRVH